MTSGPAGLVDIPLAPAHKRPRPFPYDKRPVVASGPAAAVAAGDDIGRRLAGAGLVVIDCYPGVRTAEVAALARQAGADMVVDTIDLLLPDSELNALVAADLGDDPVFGRVTELDLSDFFAPSRVHRARAEIDAARERRERVFVIGVGAALVADRPDVLVVADLARWEAQQRQREGEANGMYRELPHSRPSALYKRSFFVEWRVADAHKWPLLERADHLLDTTVEKRPLLVEGEAVRSALGQVARRPFRVVPFFDPAPWGGQWMNEVCDLDRGRPNHGWCFDCVPEENSLLLRFGDRVVEIPALDLIRRHGPEVLGPSVHERFRGEFPIRFDFLDTVEGGNLSLQVHPLEEYLDSRFAAGSGPGWTQHESYYMLDATPGAGVYLGLKDGVSVDSMFEDLERAQTTNAFEADRYVNRWPARRHDHFLIPAGTVHCSGAGGLVLEISATPFIFTFKLWDWARPGLDGRPRPVHLDHGRANVQSERTTAWVEAELVNKVEPVAAGEGWLSERTGLHPLEPIDTIRHWFRGPAPHHDTGGSVSVLNLVEGDAAVVESPDGAWDPYVVHYAETFVVPDAAGPYRITPHGPGAGRGAATIRATIRPDPT